MIPVPYKVWGNHKSHIVHVGNHTYMWGDHTIPIPYKIYGDHESHIRHEDTSHVGQPYVHVGGTYDNFHIRYGDHKIPISHKVWGDPKSHIRHRDTSHVGDHMIHVPCKVWGDHKSHISSALTVRHQFTHRDRQVNISLPKGIGDHKMHGGDYKIPMPYGRTIRYQLHMGYRGTISHISGEP